MAFGNQTIADFGGAVGDLLSSQATAAGLRLKAQGNLVEGENYKRAADLAGLNEKYTEESTALQQTAADRAIYMGIGKEQTQIAGAGFENSGTALDLLRSSAQQGALQKQVIGQQGLITEAGYTEQQKAYNSLAYYSNYAAGQENQMAGQAIRNGEITAAIKVASGLASIFL